MPEGNEKCKRWAGDTALLRCLRSSLLQNRLMRINYLAELLSSRQIHWEDVLSEQTVSLLQKSERKDDRVDRLVVSGNFSMAHCLRDAWHIFKYLCGIMSSFLLKPWMEIGSLQKSLRFEMLYSAAVESETVKHWLNNEKWCYQQLFSASMKCWICKTDHVSRWYSGFDHNCIKCQYLRKTNWARHWD